MLRASRPLLIVHALAVLACSGWPSPRSRSAGERRHRRRRGHAGTGSLLLTDDDGEAALFRLADLKGGEHHVRCIAVTSRSARRRG